MPTKDPKELFKVEGSATRVEYVLMAVGIALVGFIALKALSPDLAPSPPATTDKAAKP